MFDGFYDDGYEVHGGMGGGSGTFSETFRCYSVAMMPSRTERPELLYGGKIVLPQSALTKLSALHISWPMLFRLTNQAHDRATHSGVLEFTAEEGKVYLPQWMMQTLLLQEGQFLHITTTDLSLGTFVKIQPQSVDFLDISDPKAVLEQALRNFSTLTQGDILTFSYNDKLYDILVMETKPSGGGISIVETDLEVDFAPPVGYVEPTPMKKVGSAPTSLKGSTTTIAEHTITEEPKFAAFGGSGYSLNAAKASSSSKPPRQPAPKTEDKKENITPTTTGEGHPPAVLRLPPGKLFFGKQYPLPVILPRPLIPLLGYPVTVPKKSSTDGHTTSVRTSLIPPL
ncbi:ubiquitin fusion degradation protein 1 [Phlyctochytrium arcticum]|nr:ubiquitin fusion degradation protein 1 [Phlyctochytrium arcticum]